MDIIKWLNKEIFDEFRIALQPLIKRRKIFIFLFFLALCAIFLGQINKALIFIPGLVVLASFSMVYNIWFRVSLGVELIMLATVLCAVVYGPVVGIIVGLISLLFAEIISTKITYNTFISFIGIAIVGFIASFHNGNNITTWGIIMTVLYDVIIIPGYILTGSDPVKSFVYVATHIPFNIWVFSVIAPKLLELML